MIVCYISAGSNLGDSVQIISDVPRLLRAIPRTHVLATSKLYRSKPVDAQGPDFINSVIKVETTLTARGLLSGLQAIERLKGRVRGQVQNAPRTLDLDLLLYGDAVLKDPKLIVPHPRMHQRAFVLVPLQELDASLNIPGRGSLLQFILRTKDQSLRPIAATTASSQ
jgi:2-amino-4-hydroxy-6-hydroxymethyldihydropteridine diphosphokinase